MKIRPGSETIIESMTRIFTWKDPKNGFKKPWRKGEISLCRVDDYNTPLSLFSLKVNMWFLEIADRLLFLLVHIRYSAIFRFYIRWVYIG